MTISQYYAGTFSSGSSPHPSEPETVLSFRADSKLSEPKSLANDSSESRAAKYWSLGSASPASPTSEHRPLFQGPYSDGKGKRPARDTSPDLEAQSTNPYIPGYVHPYEIGAPHIEPSTREDMQGFKSRIQNFLDSSAADALEEKTKLILQGEIVPKQELPPFVMNSSKVGRSSTIFLKFRERNCANCSGYGVSTATRAEIVPEGGWASLPRRL